MTPRELFQAKGLPVLQNKVFRTEAAALLSPTGDMVLVQDEKTGLIYNSAFDPSKLVYDSDYQNEQAHSSVFKQHIDHVASIIERHFKNKRLIEVGCGKGYFLKHLRNLGFKITGIDPAYDGADPDVIKAPFARGLGLFGDGIILRHVLEHIQDPIDFLDQIAQANGGKGTVFIEVPSFDWITEKRAWFDFFYEHVNYFRLSDFLRMFGSVHESGYLFGGQYLYVIADLATLRLPTQTNHDRVVMPEDLLSGVEHARERIRSTPHIKHTIWGAASKGVIFSIYLKNCGLRPFQAIDINPAKQGGYLAVSGLKVSSPEEGLRRLTIGDNIFVMNSNYLVEIISQSKNQFTYTKVEND